MNHASPLRSGPGARVGKAGWILILRDRLSSEFPVCSPPALEESPDGNHLSSFSLVVRLKKKCSGGVNPCEPWLSMRMNDRNRTFMTEATMTGLARHKIGRASCRVKRET